MCGLLLCSLLRLSCVTYSGFQVCNVFIPELQKQSNGSSCGLYAIVFATTLLNEQNANLTRYNQAEMRLHLRRYLLAGEMSDFPMGSDGVFLLHQIIKFENKL